MRRLVPGPATDAALLGAQMAPRPGVLAVATCALPAVPADCTITVPTLACPLEDPGAPGPVLPASWVVAQPAVRYSRLPDPLIRSFPVPAALSCTLWALLLVLNRPPGLDVGRPYSRNPGRCGVMRWAARPVWFLAVAVVGVTGCGGSVPAPHHSPATPPAVPSAPASGAPQAQARQAYLGMWRAFVAASRTADYQSGALSQYAAGGALSVLTHGLYQNYRNGIVTRGQPSFSPHVTVASPPGSPVQATVTDCADSSHWADYYRSGKPAPGEQQGRQRIDARLQPFNGSWKVIYLVVEKEGTC